MAIHLELLQVCVWVLVGTVLCILACTMGFDLGVGTLLPFIAKNDNERRVVINSVGPTWDGNQVWLIFGGGAVFACWPMVYATAFSSLYIALMLVLWSLFLRPVGFEYRNKIDNPKWRSVWDWGLFIGSFVPALVFGVAFGNLLLGLPFHFDASLRSDYTGGFFNLLSPFAVLVGLVSVAMLVTHGSTFLQIRSGGIIQKRASKISRISAIIYVVLFALAGLWIAFGIEGFHAVALSAKPLAKPFNSQVQRVVGAWLDNYSLHPWMIIAPIMGFLGAFITIFSSDGHKHKSAFLGSILLVAGTVLTAGVSLFPFVVPSSSFYNESLTIWNATSSFYSLATFIIAVAVFLPIVIFYTQWVYRKLWHRVDENMVKDNKHVLY